jgi:hypothetical protein
MVVAHTSAFSAFVASRFPLDHSYSTSNLSNISSSAFLCRYTENSPWAGYADTCDFHLSCAGQMSLATLLFVRHSVVTALKLGSY